MPEKKLEILLYEKRDQPKKNMENKIFCLVVFISFFVYLFNLTEPRLGLKEVDDMI